MRASLRLLEGAASATTTATLASTSAPARSNLRRNPANRTGRMSAGDAAAMPVGELKHLIIDVPYTAIPTDVHRAMKEAGAVAKNFPLSAIVRQPVGSPRKATLTTRYHITAPTPESAQTMFNVLSSRPLFAAGSARASAQPGRPGFGSSTGLKDDSRVFLSNNTAEMWAGKMIQAVKNAAPADYQFAERNAQRVGGGLPDTKWALQPNTSGRRVLLRGLPRERPANLVRDFIKDMGVEMQGEGLKLVVGAPLNSRANYVVSCKTTADAHFLARRLNMTPYLKSAFGYTYLMRAHVVW